MGSKAMPARATSTHLSTDSLPDPCFMCARGPCTRGLSARIWHTGSLARSLYASTCVCWDSCDVLGIHIPVPICTHMGSALYPCAPLGRVYGFIGEGTECWVAKAALSRPSDTVQTLLVPLYQ